MNDYFPSLDGYFLKSNGGFSQSNGRPTESNGYFPGVKLGFHRTSFHNPQSDEIHP
jgi:hypothetical protein